MTQLTSARKPFGGTTNRELPLSDPYSAVQIASRFWFVRAGRQNIPGGHLKSSGNLACSMMSAQLTILSSYRTYLLRCPARRSEPIEQSPQHNAHIKSSSSTAVGGLVLLISVVEALKIQNPKKEILRNSRDSGTFQLGGLRDTRLAPTYQACRL